MSLSLWAYGAGRAIVDDRHLGALTVGPEALNTGSWVMYATAFANVGLALPKVVGAGVLAMWTVGTALRLRWAALGRSI